jgi:hypothetical protein
LNPNQLSKDQIRRLREALKVKEKANSSERRIKRLLLENSHSEDFEEARTEWVFTGTYLFEEDYGDFSPHCELCHATGLKVNFVIFNDRTNTELRVGSSCIQNFLRLGGAATQEESQQIFKRQIDESMLLPSLRIIYRECLKERPMRRDVGDFRKQLIYFLEHRGYRFPTMSESIDHIVEWLYEPGTIRLELPPYELMRLNNLLFDTSKIEMQSGKLVKDRYKSTTWQRKSRAVETTLSNSEAYQTDRITRK